VTVQVLDLGWFFENKQNFAAFTALLQNLPSSLYASLFIESILNQFWSEQKHALFMTQFLPYLTYIILAFVYMKRALSS